MTLEPTPIKEGWVKRTLINGLRLSIRSPALWFVLYVGFPVFAIYATQMILTCFMMGVAVIAGTFLCFKNDHLSAYPSSSFLAVLIRAPQPVIILCVTLGIIFSWYPDTLSEERTLLSAYFEYGIAFWLLMFSSLFASIYLLLFLDIPRIIWMFFKSRNLQEEEQDKRLAEFSSTSGFGLFSLHLTTDTDLSWMETMELSRRACSTKILNKGFFLLGTIPAIVMVCPVFLGVAIPWIYCIYREIFWGTGITEVEKKEVAGMAAQQGAQ